MRPDPLFPVGEQTSVFGSDLLYQLDSSDPLIVVADKLNWSVFDEAFAGLYSATVGRPALPIRRMVGL